MHELQFIPFLINSGHVFCAFHRGQPGWSVTTPRLLTTPQLLTTLCHWTSCRFQQGFYHWPCVGHQLKYIYRWVIRDIVSLGPRLSVPTKSLGTGYKAWSYSSLVSRSTPHSLFWTDNIKIVVLQTWAQKITCRHFDWMLQSSRSSGWRPVKN